MKIQKRLLASHSKWYRFCARKYGRRIQRVGKEELYKIFDDLNRGVVWTNGVFDILHPGHLELLKYAKNLGQKLIVGINDDESVRRLKGNGRPVNNFATRKQQLEMLPWVDEVVVFGEDTPQQILEIIRPDIIVKGGDYTTETTVGNELAEVKIFPIVKGHSTTEIIGRIKEDLYKIFDEVPIEPDTRILAKAYGEKDSILFRIEEWSWDGIYGKLLLFPQSNVQL